MINEKTWCFSPETYALLRKKQTAEIDAWLDEHVAQETGYVLDDSLTLADAAAQAKATGDALALKANMASLAPAFDSTATYAVGDLVLYDGAVYRFTAAHTGAWDAADVEQTTLGAEMEDVNAVMVQKANVDGSYDGMTVGNAEQLVSTVMTEDKAPYVFRTSGGSADIGNREYDTLIGGSVAWNQLIPTNAKSKTIPSTQTTNTNVLGSFTFVNGHVYLLQWKQLTTATSASRNTFNYIIGSNSRVYNSTSENFRLSAGDYSWMFKVSNGGAGSIGYWFNGGIEFSLDNIQIFDVTLMFGSAIADYIYSLRLSSEGEGTAYFRSLFPEPYYPYNAGELLSVNASAHVTTGFNQWDEEWELGGYSSTDGSKTVGTSTIRSKNKIRVIPGTQYYFQMPQGAWVYCYDADETLILNVENPGSGIKNYLTVSEPIQKTLPANCEYITFQCFTDYGTTYNHDICINLSWSGYRNGEYEPYVQHTYPLDSTLTLRGVPKLDASNKLYYDGDTYEADGTVTRRYGIVDLGTLSWTWSGAGEGFASTLVNPKRSNTISAIIANGFEQVGSYANYTSASRGFFKTSNNDDFYIKSSDWTSSTNINTVLSGVYLVYELATPTTETADPFQSPQIVDDFGTEQFTVTAQSGVEVPVGHVTQYPANLRDKLQHLPDIASANGDYIVRQSGTQMSLVSKTNELPSAPAEDGTYTLKCTVSDGTASYSWVADA